MRRFCWFSCLWLLGCSLPAGAWAAWEGSGSVKSLNLHLQATPTASQREGNLSANRLRLNLERFAADGGGVEFALENLTQYTDRPRLGNSTQSTINRRVDLEKAWHQDRHLGNSLQVDRLNMRSVVGPSEFTFGRQAIGFGRIALFSPLDNIAPFAPDALDTGVRPGVDALRWSYFAASGAEYRLATVFGDRKEHNSTLATLAMNVATVDFLLVGGRLRSRPALGCGIAGDFGGVGLKGEIVHYEGERVGRPGGDLHERFALAGVELWFGSDDLSLLAEYLYNGSGVGEPENYPRAALSAPLTEGLTYLLGRHYVLVSSDYQLHPLWSAQALLLWNLQDGSALLRPLLDWSLADNLSVQFFWNFTRGKEAEATLLPGSYRVRSEFGAVGESGGALLSYYF